MPQHQLPWLISVSLAVLGSIAGLSNSDRVQAQPSNIVRDASSGSQVSPNNTTQVDRILGGRLIGHNLFHSFIEFNVGAGRTVRFMNMPSGTQNVITRVTGSNPSHIDGTLEVYRSAANLFLINPNGILFGPGARLNVAGSFIASTANAIQFGDQGSFSASDVQPPSSLLTINPSALLFNQVTAQAVRSQGGRLSANGSLMLVGGQLILEDNSSLSANRVELAAVAAPSIVNLLSDSTGLQLAPLSTVALTDISLDRGVTVTANNSGVQLQGRDVTLNANSLINAPNNTVQIHSRNLSLNQNTQISSDGGSIQVQSQDVSLNQRSVLIAPNGNIQVQARDISLDQMSQLDAPNGAITVQGRRIELRNGSQFSTVTRNDRPSGNLTVTATEAVQLEGTNASGEFSSGFFTSSEGSGNAGNLILTTPSLLVRDGARILASTFSSGQGGNLQVTANTIALTGVAAIGGRSSGIFAFTEGGTGSAGTMTINTDRVIVQNGAQISTSTFNGSQGAGGNLTINATDLIQVSGISANGQTRSSILVGTDGIGNAGILTLQTPNLQVDNQAVISARTAGQGQGGSLNVVGDRITLLSRGEISAESLGSGDAGNVTIQANSLRVEDGLLAAATTGSGQGGSLQVQSDRIAVNSGGQISVRSGGSGAAGNLAIAAREVTVETTGKVTAETSGQGRGGNVTVSSDRVTVQSGAEISVNSQGSGQAGNLTVRSGEMLLDSG
ncbi:MAG TPA: filamentous hemagglutinin N-terminal domain-containing protein, partial [Microcoleaceae cyanobacterium]